MSNRSTVSSSRKRLVEPPSPRPSQIVASEPEGMLGGNILYMLIGAAGISMGASVFLYREMKKLKSDVEIVQKKSNKETKEQIESNTEAVKSIEMKINQLAQNMQSMHIYMRNSAAASNTQPPPTPTPLPVAPPPQPKLPKPEGEKKLQISKGGPRDEVKKQPQVKIIQIEEPEEEEEEEEEEIEEVEEECEGGVCKIDDKENLISIDSIPIEGRSKMVEI